MEPQTSQESALKQAAQDLARMYVVSGDVRPGWWYRHHRVTCSCRVVRVGVRQCDLKVVVIYEFPDTGNVWEHTVEDFLAVLPDGTPRFRPIELPENGGTVDFDSPPGD
jgi:hypothetical protein